MSSQSSAMHHTHKRHLHALDHSALYWEHYEQHHHCLMDVETGKPATISIIISEVDNNTHFAQYPPKKADKLKLRCVGVRPDFRGAEGYWQACLGVIKELMNAFEDPGFFDVVEGCEIELRSFMEADGHRIKFQHPLTEKLYGIEHDDLYTMFVDALGASFKTNHRGPIQPLPLYDLDGKLVPIAQYGETLYKATLEVVFTLHHFSSKEKPPQPKARAYVARPVEIKVWEPDSIVFLSVQEASSSSVQVPKGSLLLSLTTDACAFHSSTPEASVYEPCEDGDDHASQHETAQFLEAHKKLELADIMRQLDLNGAYK